MFSIQSFKEQVRIEDFINLHIGLKKKVSENYVICCPFHSEKNPSFYIYPKTQSFHCFGCNLHGDIINFVKLYYNTSFVDAIKKIAEFANIPLPFYNQYHNFKEALIKINSIFKKEQKNEVFLSWLKKRKIPLEIAQKWQIGYVPNNFLSNISEKDINTLKIQTLVPYIKGRISIPIFDNNNNIQSFSFRAINDISNNKYLHMKGYKKNNYLYGENIILQYKQQKGTLLNVSLYIVEGFFDVIRLDSLDYRAVGILGASISEIQTEKIKNYSNYFDIAIMMDGDTSGIKNAAIISNTLKQHGISHRKYSLRNNEDPDSFFLKGHVIDDILYIDINLDNNKKKPIIVKVKQKNEKDICKLIISSIIIGYLSEHIDKKNIDDTIKIIQDIIYHFSNNENSYKEILENLLFNTPISDDSLNIMEDMINDCSFFCREKDNKIILYKEIDQIINEQLIKNYINSI